ncbi:serine/threonine-protein phosphatase 6 regulatory ankyrin repeat subunit A-like [Stylophora pistillata]|uniref:serine/threonine-protein phosphatase 6 regulatory ankyrin repeat subunit A-like n=1 Tax=Stylophora pistillata TaxID=50429 RepID=UPI000C03D6C9|nr:serine/threonine-protein phosphatase 6 regulatory ankyrin repeat subunit A-like [Stylophora pistillata]
MRSTNELVLGEEDVFMQAAKEGLTNVLQLVMERGFSAIDTGYRCCMTLLTAAAGGGHYDTVVLLLDKGANINCGIATQITEMECDNSDGESEDGEGDEEDEYNPEDCISPLNHALFAKHIEVAKLLIKRSAIKSACKRDGIDISTLADLAANDADLAQLLSDNGVNLVKVEDDKTPLISALSKREYLSIPRLLEKGADVNARDERGDTALSILLQSAAPIRAMELVKLLMEYGADINIKNGRSETPLQIACSANLDKVAELFLELGCEPNVHDANWYFSPLYYAAQHDNSRLVKTLLHYGACPEEKSYGEKSTPLHAAASSNSLDAAKLLLEYGVNVEAKNSSGSAALIEAVGVGRLPMVELLIRHGSNVHTKDKYPFLFMLRRRCILPQKMVTQSSVIEWLLEQGADLTSLDKEDRSPLHAAAYEGCASSVELLIEHGAYVHSADMWGWKPLYFAAAGGQFGSCEILAQNRIDVGAEDIKGRTALLLAAKYGCREAVESLIHHEGDVNATPPNGQTILGAIAESYLLDKHLIEAFLESGCDLHVVDKVTGRTVLHFAATSGNVTALNHILDQGWTLSIFWTIFFEAVESDWNVLNLAEELPTSTSSDFANGSQIIADSGSLNNDASGDREVSSELTGNSTAEIAVSHFEADELAASFPAKETIDYQYVFRHSPALEKVAKVLLKQGSNVQLTDIDGNTPLHFTVNLPRLLKKIVNNGGDVNAVNVNGFTPLDRACFSENKSTLDAMKLLLKAGVDIHRSDNLGNTPLHIAVSEYSLEKVFDLFIEYGGEFKASNLLGRTCLHLMSRFCFCSTNSIDKVLLHGGQVNAIDELGNTPLHLALQENNVVMTKGLLKHGADPGAVDSKGSTPLHVGCFSGSWEAVSVVINYKSNLEAKDDKGCTPLHICTVFHQNCCALQLVRKGADLEAKDSEGSTPLHIASAFSDVSTVSLLLEHWASVESKDSEGGIPLHTAAALGKVEVVRVLIDAGSDVNASDVGDDTPLHVSAGSGYTEEVRLVLDNGADLNAMDKEGRTPTECAKLFGHEEIEQCLVERRSLTA